VSAYVDFHAGNAMPAGYSDRCLDCAYLTPESDRLVHGSQYENAESTLVPTHRMAGPPAGRFAGVGIRCARAP